MRLSVSPLEGDIQQLTFEGRLDLPGTEEIALALNSIVATDKQFFVADLSKVDFVASIGIGVLVRCANALRLRGGNMVLLNPQPGVRLMLEKTRIHTVIPIHASVKEACKAVREANPAAPHELLH